VDTLAANVKVPVLTLGEVTDEANTVFRCDTKLVEEASYGVSSVSVRTAFPE
jgi:hypothetical protein